MTPADWSRIKDLFPDLRALAPADRRAFLDRHCADAPAVRAELEAMVSAADEEPEFLGQRVGVNTPGPIEAEPESLSAGSLLGAWRVVSRIGRGGMGEVYAVERADGAFEMRAALKLLKRGMDTDELLARFLRERRMLARLSHPNIAHLLDAGAADDGRPWLAMEHVDGQPIDAWCRERGLSVRAIVQLMIAVCDAVYQAHREQIVHRDLKPSNVLVNAEGEPKLLDFGIAKLLAEDDPGETRHGAIAPMTPEFAAPEQLLGQPVSPATDVYALGALLFLLLAGESVRPGTTLVRALDVAVQHVPPPSLTRALRRSERFDTAAARRERLEAVSGDLELIVQKALHPEAARRYAHAAALADDLHRWLEQRPVTARPDSALYRMRRFVRRNRTASVAAAVVAIAIVAGISGVLWQARIAIAAGKAEQLQRQRAEAREASLREVVGFQGALLDRVNLARLGEDFYTTLSGQLERRLRLGEAPGLPTPESVAKTLAVLQPYVAVTDLARDALARQLLQPAQTELSLRFADQPEVEAALLDSLGRSYATLHLWSEAATAFERAAQRHAAGGGGVEIDAANGELAALASRAERVRMLFRLDRLDEALREARAVVARRTELLGPDHLDTQRARVLEAAALKSLGQHGQALAIEEPLLAGFRAQLGPRHVETLDLLANLGTTHWFLSRLPEAERELGEAIAGLLEQRDRLHPRTIVARGNLGVVLLDLGKPEAARDHLRPLLDELRAEFGEEDPQALQVELNLANALYGTGDVAGSLALEQHLIDTRLRRFGPDDLELLITRSNNALTLRHHGEPRKAQAILEDVLARRTRLLGAEHPDTLYAASNLAATLRRAGDTRGAASLGERTLAAMLRSLGPEHLYTVEAQDELAQSYRALGERTRALPLAEAALVQYRRLVGEEHTATREMQAVVEELRSGSH
ncbi:MAG TPA: serine/threonine-protein kinase [Nevskiaceae bacterium]|nr:serine/threonine-protein kinase [Nevskiaceae bacterium]